MNIFNQLFGRFLISRRTSHLFRRRVILESLPKEGRAGAIPDQLTRQLVRQAQDGLPSVLAQLNSSKEGLTDAQAMTSAFRSAPMRSNTKNRCPGGCTCG